MRTEAKVIIAVIILLIVGVFGLKTFKTVDTKCVGVVTLFGEVTGQETDEGLHWFRNPFSEFNNMPVSIQSFDMKGMSAFSKENQDVICNVNVVYVIEPSNASRVYQELRTDSTKWEGFIAPLVSNAFKSITTEYSITTLVNKREEIRELVTQKIKDRLLEQDNLFELRRIEITNMDYGKKYKDQIDERNKMTQQALQAEEQLKKEKMLAQIPVIQAQAKITTATADAEATVIRAKAEAEAAVIEATAKAEVFKLLTQFITTSVVILEGIKKWNGTLPFAKP